MMRIIQNLRILTLKVTLKVTRDGLLEISTRIRVNENNIKDLEIKNQEAAEQAEPVEDPETTENPEIRRSRRTRKRTRTRTDSSD